ncbi:cold-shock protein [Alcanivorax sp. 97CO-5]|uniref:cold-shock protein n=1 Tax=Alcanivorax TaxID=59753 RepID=UPI0003E7F428|nr:MULTISPECIES: cold shock domain-containing protein [unclassified Alcanivorax]EUC69383.1 cold-shock protein [Alcanivorax sp. 97CO-5]PKG01303.1 cold shock domain-containing protein [Alcanivorax sp. 97CO-6]
MNLSKPLTIFYVIVTLLLALPGAWLLFAPEMALVTIHENLALIQVSNIHSQQTGLGLLLAAAVNLVCLMGGRQRLPLHVAVLFYLAGLVASHGNTVFTHQAWLWVPVLVYLLPLIPFGKLVPANLPRPSLPGSNGQQRGEVKWFNPNKGFGFILTDSGEELFVHFKAVQNGGRRSLRTGTKVRFDTRMSDRGEQADNVYIEQ